MSNVLTVPIAIGAIAGARGQARGDLRGETVIRAIIGRDRREVKRREGRLLQSRYIQGYVLRCTSAIGIHLQ
jgi:hypothetical protein